MKHSVGNIPLTVTAGNMASGSELPRVTSSEKVTSGSEHHHENPTGNVVSGAGPPLRVHSTDSVKSVMDSVPSSNNNSGPVSRRQTEGGQSAQGLAHSASNTSVMSDGFEVPRRHVKAFDKRRGRQRIQGTVAGSKVRGAPEPRRELFIYRVLPTTDDDIMRDWIVDLKVNIQDFQRMSHNDSKYKSFKLTVSLQEYMYLFNPGLWPEGVCIGKYTPPRRSFNNGE